MNFVPMEQIHIWICKCCFMINTDFEMVDELWSFARISIKFDKSIFGTVLLLIFSFKTKSKFSWLLWRLCWIKLSPPFTSTSINLSTGSLTICGIVLGVSEIANLPGCKILSTMCWGYLSWWIRFVSLWEMCFGLEYGNFWF